LGYLSWPRKKGNQPPGCPRPNPKRCENAVPGAEVRNRTEDFKVWPIVVDFHPRAKCYAHGDHSTIERPDVKHINWDKIPAERLNDKFVRKLAWDGKIMIGQTLVEKGYVVPLHSHDNQQVTFVTDGLWRFKLEGKTVDVGPNEMIFIPANVSHTAEALETLVAYDVFTPPREDWINGDDAYLRAK
jgi:quercetin dioxygenase-like cupin family protein